MVATTSNENSSTTTTTKHSSCRHSHDCAMRESHVNIGFIPEPPQSLQGAPPPYMATPINSYWQPSASSPSPSRIPSAHPVHARTVRCTQCYLEQAAAERRLFERRRRVMYGLFLGFFIAPIVIFLIIMMTMGL